MANKSVVAFCTVQLKVKCDSTWSDTTTMAQIVRQAEIDARHQIARLLHDGITPDEQLNSKRLINTNVSMIEVKRIETQVTEEK